MISLEDIKARPINPKIEERFKHTDELSFFNNQVRGRWMEEEETRSWCVREMTHYGNDPKRNEEMLDDAKIFYEHEVYTDEEWEKYFLPAINAMIEYNNTFVRWHPGYLIRDKESGKFYIVEYDYAEAFSWNGWRESTNYTDLSLCELDEDGDIVFSWAWANYNKYELVDKGHTEENIAKIREYSKGGNPP